MKYCSHCGAELLDEAVLCPKCGCWVKEESMATTEIKEKLKTNICALLGFILSLISVLFFANFFGWISLAGLVLSILGLVQIKRNSDQKGRGFSIAGIIIGSIFFLYGSIFWTAMILS